MGRAKRNPSEKRLSKRLAYLHRRKHGGRCLYAPRIFFLCLIGLNLISRNCRAEEYKFEVGEIEKKAFHFGGYAEVDPVLFGLNKDSRLYKLRFYNRDEGSTLDQQGFTLQLDG
ncbi:MAG: hypothetical protein PHS17_17490, partial [Desulfobacterales bacterium]|nr:hypothetical protein [Desulfobacterales bacterium]